MERFTRPLMERCGVRLVIGKGGLREASLAAFRDLGGAYLAIIGGTAALALALAKEWSGEAGVDRAQAQACECAAPAVLVNLPEVRAAVEFEDRQRAYVAAAEQRFEGVNRCC
jgi:hypothetical protein